MAVVPIGTGLRLLAREDPGRAALTCEGTTVTRAQLDSRTNRLARAYEALGVTPGALVTIGLPNGIEFYEAAIATWKLGATPQPVSWRLPQRELREIIRLADPVLVVGVADAEGRASVPAGFQPDPALSAEPLPDRVAPSLKAMTTGGSTGRPKLTIVADRGEFDTGRRPLGMQPHQVNLVCGPLYHNSPFASTLGLFVGQHLVVLRKFDAALGRERGQGILR